MSNTLLWEKIDWQLVDARILQIQKRIFKYSLSGDKGKVLYLQDLLIHSLDTKLVAVRRVTTENKGRKTPGIDRLTYLTPPEKIKLVDRLKIDGKAVPIRRVWIDKPVLSRTKSSILLAEPKRSSPKQNQRAKLCPFLFKRGSFCYARFGCRANKIEDFVRARSSSLKSEKRPLGIPIIPIIPIIRDRAKQMIVLMALEPEWEAKFEPNSYGFRKGRQTHDAIEAIFSRLRKSKHNQRIVRWVLDADLKGCFDNLDHEYLISKLNTSPLIQAQIRAWLRAGIFEGMSLDPPYTGTGVNYNLKGTPQGGIISPFLSNVALHGMEYYLQDWILTQTWPITRRGQLDTGNKIKSIGVIRYADNFLVIHRDREIVVKAKDALSKWLANTSKLTFNEDKTKILNSQQGFDFLGFSFINVIKQGTSRIKIYPSKENQKRIVESIGDRCRKYRSISSYSLIESIRPVILGWGNYFRYCECKQVFSKIDFTIYAILRSWVFRRDRRNGRHEIKERYFPSGKTYHYQGEPHNDNWILCGKLKSKEGKPRENWLPKLSWIKSIKHVKVKDTNSVFDGDDAYWGLRTEKYGSFNIRQRNLLKAQKGRCRYCKDKILNTEVEIDHILAKSLGGKDEYLNWQLLHRHCHVEKSRLDRIKLSRLSKDLKI